MFHREALPKDSGWQDGWSIRAALLSLSGHSGSHAGARRVVARPIQTTSPRPAKSAWYDQERPGADGRRIHSDRGSSKSKFRDIAKRNARSLEEMIADRLGDSAAPQSASQTGTSRGDGRQRRMPRARSMAQRRRVTVVIEPSESRGPDRRSWTRVATPGYASGTLRESRTGERIHLAFDPAHEGRAEVRLSNESGRAADREAQYSRSLGCVGAEDRSVRHVLRPGSDIRSDARE